MVNTTSFFCSLDFSLLFCPLTVRILFLSINRFCYGKSVNNQAKVTLKQQRGPFIQNTETLIFSETIRHPMKEDRNPSGREIDQNLIETLAEMYVPYLQSK